jgi:hypothetical protein
LVEIDTTVGSIQLVKPVRNLQFGRPHALDLPG